MQLSKNTKVSFLFLFVGIISFIFADFSISTLEPFLELKKFSFAIFQIDFSQTTKLFPALFNTISIAILAMFFATIFGFLLALAFENFFVRISLAFTRAIHELFWALIFLQIFGLNTLTALLAITIPYSAILAKVYAEILQEHDNFPKELKGKSKVSYYVYTKIPDALPHLISYTFYRFECALRSTAILGFVGITTLGYYLSSSFMQGYYNEVWLLLILFYIVIATIRFWLTKYSVGFIVLASFFYLEEFPSIKIDNFIRFITSDIIPHPIRTNAGYEKTFEWFSNIFTNEILIGVFNTILLTQIALVLTAILALISFPFISLKFTNKFGRAIAHMFLVVLRSTPEYIIAYIFLQMFGPSMLPAALALMLHNGAIIAFLMGQQTNELNLRQDVTKKKNELYFYEVLPRIYSQFLAFLFYRWEIIMRESAILGILGVATLGFFIDSAIADFRLDKMMLLLVITAMLNIAIDMISRKTRNYLKVEQSITSCGCDLK